MDQRLIVYTRRIEAASFAFVTHSELIDEDGALLTDEDDETLSDVES